MSERIFFIFLFSCGAVPMHLHSQDLVAVKTAGGVEISEGAAKVLFYQAEPKSLDGKYERANYIHPLYSLSGKVLTEDFPADHPHHHGIFWSWHQIIRDGKQVADGWTSDNIAWEVVKFETRKKKHSLSLNAEVLWISGTNENTQEPIVREDARIIVHLANENYRIIDFDIRLRALVGNLKIGGSDDAKGYGGFSPRFKLPGDIRFLTKDREITPEVEAVEAGPWLDFYGSFDGEGQPESGVAVFCHPSNPGYPQPWILRREKSMQNVAFPGRAPIELSLDGLRLRYRLVIHDRNVNLEALGKLYLEYTSGL